MWLLTLTEFAQHETFTSSYIMNVVWHLSIVWCLFDTTDVKNPRSGDPSSNLNIQLNMKNQRLCQSLFESRSLEVEELERSLVT